MLRKLRAYVVLLAFSLFSALLPMRAYAFVPPALGWVGAEAFSGGALVSAGAVASVAVGGAVAGLGALAIINNSGSDCSGVAITVSGICLPGGWTRNSSGAPTPPSTTPIYTVVSTDSLGLNFGPMDPSSYCAMITSKVHTWGGTWASFNGVWVNQGSNRDQVCQTSSGYYVSMFHTGVACPSGYTISGSSCILSDPTHVQKPPNTPCQYIFVSYAGFQPDPNNPACAGANPVNGDGINWSSPSTQTATDPQIVGSSGPSGVSLNFSPGTSTSPPTIVISQTQPVTDSAGNPVTQTTTTTVAGDGSGTVTGQSVNYTSGQQTNASGVVTGGGAPVTPPVSCAQLSNCNWATAQVQTQQLAAEQQTASSTAQIHQDLQASPTSVVDPLLPSVPSLYSQKYPNGLSGVWNQHSAALSQTRFMQGIQKMFPSISGSGQAPTWTFGFDGVPGLHGNQTISVATYVWDFIRLSVIISSVFTARKIIFG